MINVFIVDDSAVVRQVLSETIGRQSDLRVSGTAPDPVMARRRFAEVGWPDVIVLDVEMPRQDGLTFLRELMAERPTPVVMCSSLTTRGADLTMEALSLGAVEVVTKPTSGLRDFLVAEASLLLGAIRGAARAKVKTSGSFAAAPHAAASSAPTFATTDRVIALGTSTGGTQALEVVLRAFPATTPGIVVVQHMPEQFTAAFSRRLDSICALTVREAANGDRVLPGHALIAPGGHHMKVRRDGAQYVVDVARGPPVNRHCPSVDVLFRSVARAVGRNATAALMTGMGDDGARGLLEIREAGGHTLAQDEASCVVFGMPREAIELGAAMEIVPLAALATKLR